jgi:hypothetical protein
VPFLDSLDIANRALDHLGATHISSPVEESINNVKISAIYDKVRRAELRRNTWRFSIRKAVLRPIDTTTYLLDVAQWSPGLQYLPGAIVADENEQLWLSTASNNINNEPGQSDVWDSYFGQMTVEAYDTTGATAYFAGDLVYVSNVDGTYTIYMSLQNVNTEVPNTPDAWSATTTYQEDQTVSFSGSQWRSLMALNLNNSPANAPASWNPTTTYASGNLSTGSDGFVYSSVINGNLNIDPTTDDGTHWSKTGALNAWTSIPTIPASSSLWTPIYAALKSLNIIYPLNSGPLSQAFTRNVYRLPAGFLRQVVSDPTKGINPFLGAAVGRALTDWEFEGDYILSENSKPIVLRFVADIQTVSEMDDMFCEGFAARIGLEACEAITNSNAKQQTCNNMYKQFMGEARIVNAIEIGPVQPPLDDYLTCRI